MSGLGAVRRRVGLVCREGGREGSGFSCLVRLARGWGLSDAVRSWLFFFFLRKRISVGPGRS